MSIFYDRTVKETSLWHAPTQTTSTHHIHTYTNAHKTKTWQPQTHTSITDFPTIAFYRQIKGISVRAVKPVTPPVICVRQSNFAGKKKKHVQREIKESIKEREKVKREWDQPHSAVCSLGCKQANCSETNIRHWDEERQQLWSIVRSSGDMCVMGGGGVVHMWPTGMIQLIRYPAHIHSGGSILILYTTKNSTTTV